MKIVFIGGRNIHKLGGIENYMYNLATELVRTGHEPIVFCESDHNGDEIVNGFKVIHQKSPKSPYLCKPWLGLKATLRVIKHIKDADVIHYNAWPPSLSSPIARAKGFTTVMQGHGLGWQRSKYNGMQQRVAKFMERIAAKLNPLQIMCSADQTAYFKKTYNKIAPTIPTAVNMPTEDRNDSETDTLRRFGLEHKKYFLFLARLVQDKNPDYLIKGFASARHQDYKLVIAGNNPTNPEYVEYLHKLAEGCPDIVFTDVVYGADKISLLRNAYAFCIPSTIEGLSISLLEAMSYRLPIIASDIPANKEVLQKDKAVWVRAENADDLAEAFEYAIGNNALLAEMAEYNFHVVEGNYTWEKVADKYIKYLNSIVGK